MRRLTVGWLTRSLREAAERLPLSATARKILSASQSSIYSEMNKQAARFVNSGVLRARPHRGRRRRCVMDRIEAQKWDAAMDAARAASSLPVENAAAPGAGALRALLREWRARNRARRALARAQARDLLDAGLSLEAVEHEIAQPFWRPLGRERK
jgi:uncharacterized protein YjiS (DUF1127 family)